MYDFTNINLDCGKVDRFDGKCVVKLDTNQVVMEYQFRKQFCVQIIMYCVDMHNATYYRIPKRDLSLNCELYFLTEFMYSNNFCVFQEIC